MSNFKALVTEVKTKMDKDVKFLIDHGIDPSIKYSNVPLYDPETRGLVLLRNVVSTSPYFSNGEKVSTNDKITIQPVKEYRVPTSATNSGNYYVKEYGDAFEISVDEFKDRIYSHQKNSDTKNYLKINDLDTQDAIDTANDEYKIARQNQDKQKQAELDNWISQYGDLFDLDGLKDSDKKQALKKLYQANQQGYSVKDLSKLPIIWKIKNKQTFEILNNKINNIKDEALRNKLKTDFNQVQKDWFRQKLDTVETLKAALDWWKNTSIKEESVLTEINFPQAQKATSIKDKYEVKQTLKALDIDDKFVTVPIIKEPIYNKQKYKSAEEDPLADPVQKLTIVSFPDASKLDDKFGLVRVRDEVSGESFNMNIGELRDLINKEENQNTELDTVDYRLQGGHQFTSLNQGMGKFVDIPEEVILEMLSVVNKENDDYEYIDLIEYYQEEKKSGIPNPLLTKALSEYNLGDNHQYVIRKFNTADGIKYKGFIPHEEHVRSKPAVAGKDPYKQLFK